MSEHTPPLSTPPSHTSAHHDATSLLPPSPHPSPSSSPTAASSSSSSSPTTTADDMRGMVVFCAPKAGMARVDANKVNSVVYQMSKDSLHFRHQQQLSAHTTRRIAQLQRRIHTLRSEPPSHLAHLSARSADLLVSLEAQRDLSHVWLHIDLDSFYASVELRDKPHLRDKPVAVGSMSMICTSNYAARQYGVRSAMPGFIAIKLCPQLHFIPTDFVKYKACAAVFRAIFAQYDPNFESASLDEAYLDITAHLATRRAQQPLEQPWDRDSEAAATAAEIRQRVFEATQLTCSAGIACNRMLAKIATDVNKPNGQHLVPFTLPAILTFISPLPVRQVPGIGKVLERTLNAIGVQTVGQMREEEYRALLVDCFSEVTCGWLFRVSLGLGRVEHEGDDERRRKSVSTERTFRDISTYAELADKVADIAKSLFEDLERLGVKGRTLTMKLKTSAFEVKQRSVSVDKGLWIHRLEDVRRLALQLLKDELNLLLAGKKVMKRAAEGRLEKGVGTTEAALFNVAGANSKVAAGSPFDNLMRIRLMGLRLSTLYIDETGEADDDAEGGGGNEGSVKKRAGGMSILKFAKRLESADQDAIVDEERAEQQSSRKRRKSDADNVDISSYFDVASPSKPSAPSPLAETMELMGTRTSESSRRNIESYFSQSTAVEAVDVDEVMEEEVDETDEWTEMLQDAFASTVNRPSELEETSTPIGTGDSDTSPPDTQLRSVQPNDTPTTLTNSSPSLPAVVNTEAVSSSSVPVSCPVCNRELLDSRGRPVSNLSLNNHVDACLRTKGSPATPDSDLKPSTAHSSARAGTMRSARGKATGGHSKREVGGGRSVSLVNMWKGKG